MHWFQQAQKTTVHSEPYPYLVVDNALPQEIYDRLASTYPDPEGMSDKYKGLSNHRYNLLSKWGAAEFPYESASQEWKAFTDAYASEEFVRAVFTLFGDYVTTQDGMQYIDATRFGPDLPKKISVDPQTRFEDMIPRVTVAVNTPVKEVSSVRGPHCDNVRKAFVGLLYFRHPDDDSSGGDLEIYKWKKGAKIVPWTLKTERHEVDLLKTIEYKPNRLVLFLCTHDALHGVSPRSITPHWRRLVVISGWFPGVDENDTDTTHGRIAGIRATAKSIIRRALGKVKAGA